MWNFYNSSGELQINDGGVQASSAVFTGNVDLGSNTLVGNGGSTGLTISADGEVHMSKQPCFAAKLSGTQSNCTGSSITATVACDLESGGNFFDLGGNYNNGTYTFTVPVDGRYWFHGRVMIGSGWTTSASTSEMQLVTTDITCDDMGTYGSSTGGGTNPSFNIWQMLELDDGDTVILKFDVNGESGNNTDLEGGTNGRTVFEGMLVA